VTSKPHRGLAFVATLCLMLVLAAAMVPAAGDSIHGVLVSVQCLDEPACIRVPFIRAIDDPRETSSRAAPPLAARRSPSPDR
jgi:hypothetical protein